MAGSGYCRSKRPPAARRLYCLAAFAVLFPVAAQAQQVSVSIPATTLDAALASLGRQSGAEIVSTEHGLRNVRTPAVQGNLPVSVALARLLEGSGYRAIITQSGAYRIVRGTQRPAPQPRPRREARRSEAPPPPAGPNEVVVTASKQRVALLRYPGSLTTVSDAADRTRSAGSVSDLTQSVPILQSTQLGDGRNKVFIRGIADSSFNGSTQAPTSVYLDDVQLNYSGPEPGLRLYDMQRVEVLEGPQGTLYGSGAIGGVIRLTTNAPDLARPAVSTSMGVTATAGGETGFDSAGMANLPILTDRVGLRAVAYHMRDGGYIDDRERKLPNVNRVDTSGGRLAVRIAPGDGWGIDASVLGQWIEARDGQYAERIEGPLTRRSRIEQPFDTRLLFGRLVVTKDWDSGLHFVSATGVTGLRTQEQFDASPRNPKTPLRIYSPDHHKELFTQEARLSRSLPNGTSWVVGVSVISDSDVLVRSLGAPNNDVSIIGVTNVTNAGSAFGEGTFALTRNLSITAGARLTAARIDGDPSAAPKPTTFIHGRRTRRIDPTLAASWRIAPQFAVFTRVQTGYRTGGLAVATGVGRVADYTPDDITVGEIGVRKLRRGLTGIAFSGSASTAYWTNIQADLINKSGQPYTANIGDAQITALEGNVDWIPFLGLRAEGSFLFTNNHVNGPIANQSKKNNRRLAETPPFAGHAALSYQWSLGKVSPRIGVSFDYIGRSVLGTGDLFDVSQGNYWTTGLVASVSFNRSEISITANNLTNSHANQFAYGNPFTLGSRDQTTPLRPFNVRIGLTTHM